MTRSFAELVHIARQGEDAARALSREECLEAARIHAQEGRDAIRQKHADGDSGGNVVHALSRLADAIVRGAYLFGVWTTPCPPAVQSRVAVCAMGGYGREELSPGSDLDVCLLFEGSLDKNIEDLNKYMIPFLWDLGFKVGYTTYSIPEAMHLARTDMTAFTSYLEGRLICGDSSVFARLKLYVRELQSGEMADRFIQQKVHDRTEGLPEECRDLFHPEPNLKENAGGLRDFHTALWLLMMAYGVNTLDDAVAQGIITSDEQLDFVEGLDVLWRIRNELHFLTNTHQDTLSFALQRPVAKALGYAAEGHSNVWRFMGDYYKAAVQMRRFLGIACRSCNLQGPLADEELPAQPDITVVNGELYAGIGDPDWFSHHPPRLMEVFWRCARNKTPLSRSCERLVRQNLHLVHDTFRSSDVVRRFFVALCNRPYQAGFALRQAASVGLLSAYLPEFGAVEDVIRYEDFHHYPVNEHTLRAIEALSALENAEGPVMRCLREALENLSDPYVLVMAILFHDLGKAAGDVHTEESVRLTGEICQRMGMPPEDEERISFLVEHHTLMTNLSQYRDVDDNDMVQAFAETMKTEQRLRALFLLSYADLSAVAPNVWNDWKGALLMKLYLRAVKRLLGRVETAGEEFWESGKVEQVRTLLPEDLRDEAESHVRGLGQRYLTAFSAAHIAEHIKAAAEARAKGLSLHCVAHAETGKSEVVVCTTDRHGLFSNLAGCFSSQLIDVNDASLFTRPDGVVVDCFTVADARREAPLTRNQTDALHRTLQQVLQENHSVQELVEHSRRRLFALLQPRIPIPTRILFDNDSSRTHTVIDIETGDRTGLLYDITRAMSEAGLDIATARIVTDARRVRDSFYVTQNQAKIEDPNAQEQIRVTLHQAIHPRATLETKGGTTP